MAKDYKDMTNDDFDRLLIEVIDAENEVASGILRVPGVYEILSEYYNNSVLEAWDLERSSDVEDEQ